MTQALNVSIESPQSGFMSLRLRAGEQSIVMGASCMPHDSLLELIEALSVLLESGAAGEAAAAVRWNCEPEEYDFRFTTHGARVRFTITHHLDQRRTAGASRQVFSWMGSEFELCVPFWRELRDLRRRIATDVYDQNWRRPFPHQQMRRLTELLRGRKREVRQVTRQKVRLDVSREAD